MKIISINSTARRGQALPGVWQGQQDDVWNMDTGIPEKTITKGLQLLYVTYSSTYGDNRDDDMFFHATILKEKANRWLCVVCKKSHSFKVWFLSDFENIIVSYMWDQRVYTVFHFATCAAEIIERHTKNVFYARPTRQNACFVFISLPNKFPAFNFIQPWISVLRYSRGAGKSWNLIRRWRRLRLFGHRGSSRKKEEYEWSKWKWIRKRLSLCLKTRFAF